MAAVRAVRDLRSGAGTASAPHPLTRPCTTPDATLALRQVFAFLTPLELAQCAQGEGVCASPPPHPPQTQKA